jgi:5-methyltetrahydropteroyltriglutamate--homocysteine methyltransferase
VHFKELRPEIGVGLGVIDIKRTVAESPDDVARAIAHAEQVLGEGRITYIHPDCGFWMLKRGIADEKMRSLVKGRNLYMGVNGSWES